MNGRRARAVLALLAREVRRLLRSDLSMSRPGLHMTDSSPHTGGDVAVWSEPDQGWDDSITKIYRDITHHISHGTNYHHDQVFLEK